MADEPKEGSGGKRTTLAAFPSRVSGRDLGLYGHMFVEDISVGLMGFRYSRDSSERHAMIEGNERGSAAVEKICTSVADDGAYPDEAATLAIESIGRRLAWFGKAIYEVCGTGEAIALASISPYGLFNLGIGFLQVVPKTDRQFLNKTNVFLPSRRAFVINVPQSLGGPWGYRHLTGRLSAVSEVVPRFWSQEIEMGKLTTEFNVSDYNRARNAYVARLTRRWGWNRRDASGTNDTEFFYFFRSLRFRRAQAILRGHIVATLNRFFARRGIEARISLVGFRSAVEIEDLLVKAADGSLPYAEALKQAE